MKRFLALSLVFLMTFAFTATAFADCTRENIVLDPVVESDGSVSYFDPRYDHCPPVFRARPIVLTDSCCPPRFDCPAPTCRPRCVTPCEVTAANMDIKKAAHNILSVLDRELAKTDWTRAKVKRILSRSGRVIYGDTSSGVYHYKSDSFDGLGAIPVKFKNEAIGLEVDVYIVIRTPDSCRKVCSGRNYYALFTTNFNTGSAAADYEPEWLVAVPEDTKCGTAVRLFVDWLVSLKPEE